VRARLLPEWNARESGAPGGKKLKDAARRWATGGALAIDEENTLAALKKFNATPAQLEEVREQFNERRRHEGFAVWPENWRAFELFLALDDQWDVHMGAMGGVYYQGIDVRRLDSVEARVPPLPDIEVPAPRELLRQFKLLVNEAKQHLNQG
jgi:hypothetical protein